MIPAILGSQEREDRTLLDLLLGKGKTALQIRDFLSGEFTPLTMGEVMAVLKAREASGAIRLVRR